MWNTQEKRGKGQSIQHIWIYVTLCDLSLASNDVYLSNVALWNPATGHNGPMFSGIISSSEAGLAAQSFLNAPLFGADDGKKWLRSVLPDRNLSVKWLEAKLGCEKIPEVFW